MDWGDAASSNASGKSLLTREVLLWGLFGKMARHKDRAISDQPCHPVRGAKVVIEVDDLVITRSRSKKGAAQFSITRDGAPVRELSRDPNVRVDDVSRLLGFDYRAFTSAVILGGETSLAEASFAVQMEALESVLRLDELSRTAEIAAKEANVREKKRDQVGIEVRFAAQTLADAQAMLGRVEREADPEFQIRTARTALAGAKAEEPEIEKARAALDTAEQEYAFWQVKYQEAAAYQRQIEKDLQDLTRSLKSATCPTCGTVLQSEPALAHLNAQITEKRAGLANVETAAQTAARTFTAAKQTRDLAMGRVQELRTVLDAIPHLERQLALLQEQAAGRAVRLADAQARLQTATGQADEAKAVYQAWEISTARAVRCATSFGRDGLQAWLFETAVPVLNHHAARFSQVFTNGQIGVTFKPTRTSRAEDLLQITGTSAPTFDGCSRGEKERINLIIALALRELARWRLGEPVNLAVFDETFDGLDEAGIAKVAAFLLDEVKTGGTIIVVTHSASLKRLFPGATTLRVVRSGGEAVVYGV